MRRLPAEWEPQAAVMLTWPHAETDWAEQLDAVEAVYRRLAELITREQGLLIVCRDEAHQRAVQAQLADLTSSPRTRVNDAPDQPDPLQLDPMQRDPLQRDPVQRDPVQRDPVQQGRGQNLYGRIQFALAPSNDTWARDHGPITVIDGGTEDRVLVNFGFNGWGGKYPAALDDRITAAIHAAGGFAALTTAHPNASAHPRLESSPLVLEGGAVESDGAGTLLAVRRTIVDPARNPGWSAAAIEQELRERLGVARILWLEHGQLSGDDTDGHIDTLARFCDPETICYAASDDPNDPDHASLRLLADELRGLRRQNGAPYRLVPLPQPGPIFDAEGQRLPAGYANFLIINRAVLVPVYRDPADALACERLQQCFTGRRIEPVDCRALIRQGGSLHCITMQLPAADAGHLPCA
nr:agmatine deiminase family protein [Halochromatium glycolicum]